LFIETFVVLN